MIAADHAVDEIAEFIGVDSLAYQTVEGLVKALPGRAEDYCLACFTGNYPVPAEDGMGRDALESRRQ